MPAIKPGLPNQPFDNIDLYSVMAEILKIKPAETDGSIAPLCSILKPSGEVVPYRGRSFESED